MKDLWLVVQSLWALRSSGQLILSVLRREFSSYPFTKELKLAEVCFPLKARIGLFLVPIQDSNGKARTRCGYWLYAIIASFKRQWPHQYQVTPTSPPALLGENNGVNVFTSGTLCFLPYIRSQFSPTSPKYSEKETIQNFNKEKFV